MDDCSCFEHIPEQCYEESGEESTASIEAGLKLAIALRKAYYAIEAERLLTKLSSYHKQPTSHKVTKEAESGLQHCKVWYVKIKSRDESESFQALRYEEDGRKCVVQGPIVTPRNIQDEITFTVASEDIYLTLGTPVVCHGLKFSTHLNGKIGDLRSWDEASGLFKVHFEDTDLEPCPVKQDFMRILFELPDE